MQHPGQVLGHRAVLVRDGPNQHAGPDHGGKRSSDSLGGEKKNPHKVSMSPFMLILLRPLQ